MPPIYDVQVEFVFAATCRVSADSEADIPAMVAAIDHEGMAHLNGKSYADIEEVSRRDIVSITEVI